MKELIRIDTTEQGRSVVSARQLYNYLEVKTAFTNWCKRMFEYGFVPEQDYIEVYAKNGINPTNGRPSVDFALTIDAAKEISMLQRSVKGKEARQYFIDAEKTLQLLTKGNSSQFLVEQAKRIEQLERKLGRVIEAQQQAAMSLLELPRSTEPLPVETTRMKVKRIVNAYCRATGQNQKNVWRLIYQRLFYLYRIKIRACKRSYRESWLDVVDRKGHIDKIYAIVSEELKLPEFKANL